MKIDSVGRASLKIMGFYSLVLSVKLITGAIQTASLMRGQAESILPFILVHIISSGIFLFLAAVLILGTSKIMPMLVLPDIDDNLKTLDPDNFVKAALAIVGIVLFVDGLSRSFYIPGLIKSYLQSIDPVTGKIYPFYLSESLARAVEITFRFCLGLYLFIGGDGLMNFWKRYREKKILID